jgi:hypothetical protein
MAYIGTKPTAGNFQICDAISVVNGQAAYTMQVGSVNVIPQSANHMIVSLNGVIQKPGSSFTVSGSTITFASNLATGDAIDFIQILGDVLDLGTPSDATVSTAKLADDAVTLAKMASGTDGNIISYDASGNPVAIATGNDGQVLTSTGAGSPPAFETLVSGFTLGTPVATTSGSFIDFTGIPSTAKMIILNMQNVSLSGSDHIRIQIGDSGGVETSGYDCGLGEIGSGSSQDITNGLPMYVAQSGRSVISTVFITLSNSSTNLYNLSCNTCRKDSSQMQIAVGKKALSGVLDRVRIETTGSDTFDTGTANIMYL